MNPNNRWVKKAAMIPWDTIEAEYLCNYSTIEFRLFRGTLKVNTLYATLQFVNRIIDTALTLSEDEIAAQSWSDFVAAVTEPELIRYLKERRIYINEEVKAEEDM